MKPSDYGTILDQTKLGKLAMKYVVKGPKFLMNIILTNDGTLLQGQILSEALFTWEDRKKEYGIKRVVNGNLEFHFLDGQQISFRQVPNLKPFTVQAKDKALEEEFICIDIETADLVDEEGKRVVTPYLICGYDGKESVKIFRDSPIFNHDLEKEDKCVKRMFNLFIKKLINWSQLYGDKQIFAHN